MKFKLTSIAVAGVLLLTSACASNVSTNATNAPAKTAPTATVAPTTDQNGFIIKTRTASEITEFLGNDKDRVFFTTDSATISDDAKATIAMIAPILSNTTNTKYVIEGHADERGTRAYNLALGKKRANALKKVLVSNNLNAQDITTITYGKDRPENPAHDAQAWSENRRAVIVAQDK